VVLLACKIVETPTLGRYLVQSTRDGVLFYEATSWNCSCPDRQRHADEGLRCKHSWALTIRSSASAVASRERAEAGRVVQPVSCQACGHAADLLDGLCATCLEREADTLDPDAPIPYMLTAQGEAAIAEPAPIVA
jgi:hypothetical protein